MEDINILELVIDNMKDRDLWFTTKSDPTYTEPGNYIDLNEYGEPTEKSEERIIKEVNNLVGNGAIDIEDAVDVWIQDQLTECTIDYIDNLKTKFEPKPVVDQIDAYHTPTEAKLTEQNTLDNISIKQHLTEDTERSRQVIASMMSSEDFDANSNEGKIVTRTLELLNKLQDANYEVDVKFDNGESLSTVSFDNGLNVNITINTSNEIIPYASGNFEINTEVVQLFNNLLRTLQNI